MSRTPFTQRVIELIRSIPTGTVATYGGIACMAGSPRAARQVVRILHTCTEKESLPWHRVINKQGRVSLKPGQGYERQKELLVREGVVFDSTDAVDLEQFHWDLERAVKK